MPATETPSAFILWYRPDRAGARWRKIGRFAEHSAVVGAITGPGCWWIAVLRDSRLASTPKLFDSDESAPAPDRPASASVGPQHSVGAGEVAEICELSAGNDLRRP